MKKRMLSVVMASVLSVTLLLPGITAYADNTNNPYNGNRTVTGRYDLTSTGEVLNDAYDTPIDKTDVTAINDPDQFCELMNQYCNPNEETNPGKYWNVDWSKPVVESGESNIYVTNPNDSREFPNGNYKIIKTSKAKPWRGGEGQVYEVRVYGFENGYLLVNTTRNGIYFNERGEAVVNGAVVKHTNNCYYGDKHWDTTLAMKRKLSWTYDPLTWENNPIFYHTNYNVDSRTTVDGFTVLDEIGFGSCCNTSHYIFE